MGGPKPKYQPVFDPMDLEGLQKISRETTAPYAQVVRARLALLLAQDPALPSPEAARRLGIHEQTARNWRRRWVKEGFSLKDKPRPGGPRAFSPSGPGSGEGHRLRDPRRAG